MVHANAALTPRARLRLARLIVEDGWRPSEAAKMFMVSVPTARKWAARFRAEGPGGMVDRSSRPRSCPHRTPELVKRQIVGLRWRQCLGPVQIGGRLGVPPSTVHAVLVRCRMNRRRHVDRVTGEPIRRYEHPRPGSMIHVDVTTFGNIPDGGGWRYVGQQIGTQNKSRTALRTGRTEKGHPNIGTAFLHTVIDDHSRVAYVEICTDEKAVTAIGVLRRHCHPSPGSRTTCLDITREASGFVRRIDVDAGISTRCSSNVNHHCAHAGDRRNPSAAGDLDCSRLSASELASGAESRV